MLSVISMFVKTKESTNVFVFELRKKPTKTYQCNRKKTKTETNKTAVKSRAIQMILL